MNCLTPFLRAAAFVAAAVLLPAQERDDRRTPDLPPGCEALRVPDGHVASSVMHALGFQIWRWDAATNRWTFVEPLAVLYADRGFHGVLGIHFRGPTWATLSGSSVVGSLVAGVSVEPTAIPWLLLRATSSQGPGPFGRTTYIQRLHTSGGLAPARAGVADEVVWVPYTADYWFYRAR